MQAPEGTLARTLDALRVRVIDGTASSWWDGYGHARAYHDQHGNLDAPTTHVTAGGFRLGAWLSAQRAERNSGTMPADRIRHLDQIGMIWDRLDAAWMSAYQELRAFNDHHGHFEVPMDYRTADDIKLAEWQGTQRDVDRAGKMTASRKALLDQIGFPWDPAEARWMRRYRQLTDALARHGGPANLPAGSPEATWLEGQHLAHHRGKLPGDKITLLEQAGIAVRRPDPWARLPGSARLQGPARPPARPRQVQDRRRVHAQRLAARPARQAQSRPADRRAGGAAGGGRILLGPARGSLARPLPGSRHLAAGTRQPRPPPQAPPEGMAVPPAEKPPPGSAPGRPGQAPARTWRSHNIRPGRRNTRARQELQRDLFTAETPTAGRRSMTSTTAGLCCMVPGCFPVSLFPWP